MSKLKSHISLLTTVFFFKVFTSDFLIKLCIRSKFWGRLMFFNFFFGFFGHFFSPKFQCICRGKFLFSFWESDFLGSFSEHILRPLPWGKKAKTTCHSIVDIHNKCFSAYLTNLLVIFKKLKNFWSWPTSFPQNRPFGFICWYIYFCRSKMGIYANMKLPNFKKKFFWILSISHTFNLAYCLWPICCLKMIILTIFIGENEIFDKNGQNKPLFDCFCALKVVKIGVRSPNSPNTRWWVVLIILWQNRFFRISSTRIRPSYFFFGNFYFEIMANLCCILVYTRINENLPISKKSKYTVG